MFPYSVFLSSVNARFSSRYLIALLLIVLLLGSCKSATTPTQTQTQATPQSQTTEPNGQQSAPQSTPSNSAGPARSSEEIISDLDVELDASIAVFGGMILEERAKAEAIDAGLGGDDGGAGQSSGNAGPVDDSALFEDGDIYEGLPGYGEFPETADEASGEAEGTQANHSDSDAEQGDSHEAGSDNSGGLETTQRGGVPEDIESGSDDDIVARQIREAALKEKDPVLRDKLWDEYRKYKNR